MSRETSKACRRRATEQQRGEFPWGEVIRGDVLDIGPGDDPHPKATRTFDKADGDANRLFSYFKRDTFDTIHASQCLEHVNNPFDAVKDWLKTLKPGGHLVVTVPSWELYEGMIWPSRFNPDHKSTWSLWDKHSHAQAIHVFVPEFCQYLRRLNMSVLRATLIDTNYNYEIGSTKDQTWIESDNVEAFIEIVARKK